MIGRIAVVAASTMALQACASNAPADLREAVLLNPGNMSVRESLRVIVREGHGGGVMVDPDSLASGSVLRLTERQGYPGNSRISPPLPTYRLMADAQGRCYLSRDGDDALLSTISDAARCQPI